MMSPDAYNQALRLAEDRALQLIQQHGACAPHQVIDAIYEYVLANAPDTSLGRLYRLAQAACERWEREQREHWEREQREQWGCEQ